LREVVFFADLRGFELGARLPAGAFFAARFLDLGFATTRLRGFDFPLFRVPDFALVVDLRVLDVVEDFFRFGIARLLLNFAVEVLIHPVMMFCGARSDTTPPKGY